MGFVFLILSWIRQKAMLQCLAKKKKKLEEFRGHELAYACLSMTFTSHYKFL